MPVPAPGDRVLLAYPGAPRTLIRSTSLDHSWFSSLSNELMMPGERRAQDHRKWAAQLSQCLSQRRAHTRCSVLRIKRDEQTDKEMSCWLKVMLLISDPGENDTCG
ncbi:Hypothetical predicted protein [Marmota monax]|uniref:Uncharacterized protein n=1 Tax=Marmota monax TaxID=9995 RepID=A0A5E4BLB9_MARMO|nr:Hypothetical predicted protein [Marmota monax]